MNQNKRVLIAELLKKAALDNAVAEEANRQLLANATKDVGSVDQRTYDDTLAYAKNQQAADRANKRLLADATKNVGRVDESTYNSALASAQKDNMSDFYAGLKKKYGTPQPGSSAYRSNRFKGNVSAATNNMVGRSSGILGAFNNLPTKSPVLASMTKKNALIVELLKYAAGEDQATEVVKAVTPAVNAKKKQQAGFRVNNSPALQAMERKILGGTATPPKAHGSLEEAILANYRNRGGGSTAVSQPNVAKVLASLNAGSGAKQVQQLSTPEAGGSLFAKGNLTRPNVEMNPSLNFGARPAASPVVKQPVKAALTPRQLNDKRKAAILAKYKAMPIHNADGSVYKKPESNFFDYAKNRLFHHINTSKTLSDFVNPIASTAARGAGMVKDSFDDAVLGADKTFKKSLPYYFGNRAKNHFGRQNSFRSAVAHPIWQAVNSMPATMPEGWDLIMKQLRDKGLIG